MVLVALCEFIDLLASFTIREHDLRLGRRNETHIISTLADLLLIHFSFLILSICNWTMYNVVKKDLFVDSTYLLLLLWTLFDIPIRTKGQNNSEQKTKKLLFRRTECHHVFVIENFFGIFDSNIVNTLLERIQLF